jgi:vesicle transport protein SEC22
VHHLRQRTVLTLGWLTLALLPPLSIPTRCTSIAHHYSYAIEQGVCYLCVCESQFPKANAFAYLEDIQQEFNNVHGADVNIAARPYFAIAFESYLEKSKRKFTESGGSRDNLSKVNTELHNVQRIMEQNIEDVLDRGRNLDSLENKATNLRAHSKTYLKNAKQLSWDAMMRKWAPVAAVVFIILLTFFYIFYF